MAVRNKPLTPAHSRLPQRYAIHEQIARGGMGTVFRATDQLSGESIAYKRLWVGPSGSRPKLTALFEREYATLARLRHPSIVEVYDYGVDSEGP